MEILKNDKNYLWSIFYISHSYQTETHIDNTLKPLLKKNIYQIECGKYDRNSIVETILGVFKTITAIFDSKKIINKNGFSEESVIYRRKAA